MKFLLILSCLLMICIPTALTQPMVNTKLGPIRGFRTKMKSGRELFAFTKIPYGQPLAGTRWFKAPIPVKSMESEVLRNTSDIDCSPMSTLSSLNSTGNCLTLNVYSQNLTAQPPVPVLFWIRSTIIKEIPEAETEEADKLMTPNTVLVIVRSRQGFIDHFPDTEKMKLLDEALALQWVYNHIMNFGGDPKKLLLGYHKESGVPLNLLRLILPFVADEDEEASKMDKAANENETEPKIQPIDKLTEFIPYDDSTVETDLSNYKYLLLDQWPEAMTTSIYHNAKKKLRDESQSNMTETKGIPLSEASKPSKSHVNGSHFQGRKLLQVAEVTNEGAANEGVANEGGASDIPAGNNKAISTGPESGNPGVTEGKPNGAASKLKISAIWIILHLPLALSM